MMRKIFIALVFLIPLASSCKNIIVMNNATSGDYNLLLKVRDPSRQGLQVLFMVNEGYEYNYHHPWKGYSIPYRINYKLIGVATKGDVPPNIIKAGMLLSNAGIAYGDADCPTYYINPTKYAWDDFDWLRYAAQSAGNEDVAVEKLKEVVDMHAVGIGENLFVVGPLKGYVIEADAFHFLKEEVKDIAVMSNYPKKMWNVRLLKRLQIAPSFDEIFDGNVKKWEVVRLGGILGVRILKIGDGWISARQIPFGEKIKIEEGKGAKVGNFYVKLEEANGRTAHIMMCYEYHEWEKKIMEMLFEKYGKINVMDLMNISRLHEEDLEGLRGFCEGNKKAAMIFKIPTKNYDKLSMGWFAPDQCVSIFVPIHICNRYIYHEYENGEAAELALNLFLQFGHGINFSNIERVFIKENEKMERLAEMYIQKAGDILTSVDVEMQRQAIMMQKIWLYANEEEREILLNMWNENYYKTICNIEKNFGRLSEEVKGDVAKIVLSIGKMRVEVEKAINGSNLNKEYNKAEMLIKNGKYIDGIKIIKNIYEKTDKTLFGVSHERKGIDKKVILATIGILSFAIILILVKKKK